ncbi:MAG TPA: ribosome biogenesis GTPase Der, partial [bacterium]|nr:ribosome biogenesis GTPase Der [bacterium]
EGIPAFPISAATGQNCMKIFRGIDRIDRALATRVSTSKLNRIMEEALAGHHLPDHRGKQVRVYYATQTGTRPPTFTLFSNFPAAVPYTYRRYLTRRIQEAIGAEGIPVRIVCRKK